MDIRSLIDSDATGSASKTPVPPRSSSKESNQLFKSPDSFKPPQNTHQGFRDYGPDSQQLTTRTSGADPSPVPPLRAPPHDDFRSPNASSYTSTHSPYQKTPSYALSAAQYPFSHPAIHSPAQSAHSTQHYQHEGQPHPMNTSTQGSTQQGSLPQTPTSGTPGGSYPPFHQHRPHSSHSASTTNSGHAQTPTFFRDSPQQSHAQIRGQYVSNPNQHHLSQPGTPLGPPTMAGRQSSSLRRESPGSYKHKRTFSGGSNSQHQQAVQSPSNPIIRSHSRLSPAAHGTIQAQNASHPSVPPPHQERERSLSVSPKTRLPSQPQLHIPAPPPDPGRTAYAQAIPSKRKMGDSRVDEASFQQQPSAKRSMSFGVGDMLNASNDNESNNQRIRTYMYQGRVAQDSSQNEEPRPNQERSPTPKQTALIEASLMASHGSESNNQRIRSHLYQSRSAHDSSQYEEPKPYQELSSASDQTASIQSIPSAENHSVMHESPIGHKAPSGPSRHPSHESQHPPRSSTSETITVTNSPFISDRPDSHGGRPMTGLGPAPGDSTTSSKREVPNGRVRYREIPIFAQSARQTGHVGQRIRGPRPLNGQSPSLIQHQVPTAMFHPPVKQPINGEIISGIDSARSQLDPTHILGEWEPTITNVIPAEELTREISNYLFQSVVQMNGVAFGPAGGSTAGPGAVVEIEAKIGQIIDKNTNDRLRLPVMTECMLSRTDPNLRTAFRSSMTAAQHSRLNNFLNGALKASKPPLPGEAPAKKPRVPLDYVHTYETDTFYDLSTHAWSTLPPSVQNYLDRRIKPKVRVTTDQKTGQVTAKIIKVRISDIEIYSPQTPFDWRVSISLEVNYDGDLLNELRETSEGRRGPGPDRNKDRVSYKHAHYQIDLTQVKSAEGSSVMEKEHELEVEISSAAVREQGQLVLQRQPNKYEELIKGFVDNVRTLVRHCRE
ncbi:MAG: hypothetical protein L6R35_006164 [Caloplaca aegaea]|nr:MAG: hypothetical protein L6R35_006164 [Caloplaca aegaea]